MDLMTLEEIMNESGLSRYKVTQMLIRAGIKHNKGEMWIVPRETAERVWK